MKKENIEQTTALVEADETRPITSTVTKNAIRHPSLLEGV